MLNHVLVLLIIDCVSVVITFFMNDIVQKWNFELNPDLQQTNKQIFQFYKKKCPNHIVTRQINMEKLN